MDPLSVTANLVRVIDGALQITTALVEYARDTKNASSVKQILAEETLFLSKLLQRLRDRAQTARHDETWLADHKDTVRPFETAYDDLAMKLEFDAVTGNIKEESKLKAVRTMVRWSFSKSEVYSLLERITRLQQYVNVLLADDQQSVFQASSRPVALFLSC